MRLAVIPFARLILETDAAVSAACDGTVRLHYGIADRDEVMPYIAHYMDSSTIDSMPQPFVSGFYQVSIYDRSDAGDRAARISQAIKGALADKIECFPGDGTKGRNLRFFLEQEREVPTGNERVWRTDLTFLVRGYDKAMATSILNRTT